MILMMPIRGHGTRSGRSQDDAREESREMDFKEVNELPQLRLELGGPRPVNRGTRRLQPSELAQTEDKRAEKVRKK